MPSKRSLLTTIKNLPCWIVISGGVLLGLLLEIISVYLIFAHYTWHTAVIFQNADEVRATGGFFGSLLWVEGQGARINHYRFYDVYDLQAQIGHFPPAPAAVRRYLSGGRSRLQLQDANWERDFALSASTISSLLQQARLPAPDIVIAVNSTLVERILTYLQSHLPDYNLRDEHGTLITADPRGGCAGLMRSPLLFESRSGYVPDMRDRGAGWPAGVGF